MTLMICQPKNNCVGKSLANYYRRDDMDIRLADSEDINRIKSMWIGNGSVSFTISSSNF